MRQFKISLKRCYEKRTEWGPICHMRKFHLEETITGGQIIVD